MKHQVLRITMLLALIVFGFIGAQSQTFPHVYIVKNGDPSSKVNLVFVGDGYLPSQLDKYIADVTSATNKMFEMKPFKALRDNFNVIAIKVPSNKEGAANSPNSLIDNYFGSSYNSGGIERLLVPNRNVSAVLNSSFAQYDAGIIIVNDKRYGGSGGTFSTFSTHESASDLLVHELAHSYANLADEYWFRGQEKENMTADSNPNTNRWREFIGTEGIGVYRHEDNPGSKNYYRPHQSCKMRFLSGDFCLVCRNHLENVTNNLIDVGDIPAVPINLESQNVKSTSFDITWSEEEAASSYDVQQWDEGDWISKGNTRTASFSFSGLVLGSANYVRVRAANENGSSEWTNFIVIQLKSETSKNPRKPTNLNSYNLNSTYFGIFWDAVARATSYDVQFWNGSDWEYDGTTSDYYYYFRNLAAGGTHYVRVRSKNTTGASNYTTHITVKLVNKGISARKELASLPSLEEATTGIVIYPNSVTRDLNIEGLANQGAGAISIIDMSGKLLLEKAFDTDESKVDVSALKSGDYILIVKHYNGASVSRRFTKD